MTRPEWIAVGAGGSFVVLAGAVWLRVAPVVAMDTALHTWAITTRNDSSIVVARAVTEAGSTFVAIPLILVLGLIALAGRPLAVRVGGALLFTAVAALGAALGLAVNAVINGVRPGQVDWAGAAGGPTFPSGHTTVATLLAAALVWTVVRRTTDPRARAAAWGAAVCIAVGVGVSRVWLGVHWPSDVMGGWLYGAAWAGLAIAAADQVRRRRHAPVTVRADDRIRA